MIHANHNKSLFLEQLYLQKKVHWGHTKLLCHQYIDSHSFTAMNGMLNAIVEEITSCERIINTPVPIAYPIYLKRLILICCIGLPFHFVTEMG